MTFDELMIANGKRVSLEEKKERALREMFCSKPFLHERDVARFRNRVENDAKLMHELLARVSFLYETELDRCADYKRAYVENQSLRAQINIMKMELSIAKSTQ